MRLGEFYSVVCKIFAINFSNSLNEALFDEIRANGEWFVINSSKENLEGRRLYKEAIEGENLQIIAKDFANLQRYFLANSFFENEDERLGRVYEICSFKPNLTSLKMDSISNEFSFISAIFAKEADEQTREILGIFLSSYLLPYAYKLCVVLQNEAESKFYKSLGYLLEDFAKGLEKSLKIKVVAR